jgi:hypothetical protein
MFPTTNFFGGQLKKFVSHSYYTSLDTARNSFHPERRLETRCPILLWFKSPVSKQGYLGSLVNSACPSFLRKSSEKLQTFLKKYPSLSVNIESDNDADLCVKKAVGGGSILREERESK